jgi:hypothetical protein
MKLKNYVPTLGINAASYQAHRAFESGCQRPPSINHDGIRFEDRDCTHPPGLHDKIQTGLQSCLVFLSRSDYGPRTYDAGQAGFIYGPHAQHSSLQRNLSVELDMVSKPALSSYFAGFGKSECTVCGLVGFVNPTRRTVSIATNAQA